MAKDSYEKSGNDVKMKAPSSYGKSEEWEEQGYITKEDYEKVKKKYKGAEDVKMNVPNSYSKSVEDSGETTDSYEKSGNDVKKNAPSSYERPEKKE